MDVRRVVMALVGLLALSGCGMWADKAQPPAEEPVAKPKPSVLLAHMWETLAVAESFAYSGTIKVGNDVGELEAEGDVKGTYAQGYVSVPGGSVHYRVVGQRVYVTGGDDLATALAGGRPPGDSWVVVKGTPLGLDLRDLTPGQAWTSMMKGPPPRPAPHARVREVLSAEGHPAFVLMCVDRETRQPYPVTIAADGSWQLLQIGRADEKPYLQFSKWNRVKPVAEPAQDELLR